MSHFDTPLVNHIDIRLPSLHVRTFALHRPLPSLSAIGAQHRSYQAILCLSGMGQQILANRHVEVEPGVLVMLPPGHSHAFHPTADRMPLCLIIDFSLKGKQPSSPVVCNISRSELSDMRQHLAYLLRIRSRAGAVYGWESSALILQLLITLLRAAGWLERVPLIPNVGEGSAIHRLLLTMEPETPLSQIVKRSGYQRDHFNRLMKVETGLTLGQFRTQRRLEKAKELLSSGVQVGNVAAAVGLLDQSYFARWFRRQTGVAPSRWMQQGSEGTIADLAVKYG